MSAAKRQSKQVYLFGAGAAEGEAGLRDLLGGKGANLAEMSRLGLPVPPGFTITTEVCTAYYANGEKLPSSLHAEVERALDARASMKAIGDMAAYQAYQLGNAMPAAAALSHPAYSGPRASIASRAEWTSCAVIRSGNSRRNASRRAMRSVLTANSRFSATSVRKIRPRWLVDAMSVNDTWNRGLSMPSAVATSVIACLTR